MTTPDPTPIYHDQVTKFFAKTARAKARATKFVQRTSPLDGHVFLLALVLTVLQHGTIVLEQLAKAAHKINPALTLTGQAFKERFNAYAVAFLQAMCAEALQLLAPAPTRVVPLLASFSAVYLLDATTVTLPAALAATLPGCGGAGAQAAAKVYLLLNWLTGAYETLRIAKGRQPDQSMGPAFVAARAPGALWLFDLGFFNATFLAALAQAQSFFLCRLAASQLIFWTRPSAGTLARLELDRLLRRSNRELFEIAVVFGAQQQVSTRLIIAPVPRAVAAQRRRRVREAARKQGRTPTQTTLRRCDWTLLLTNARAAQLPTSTVREVYRVRWQIELVFKLWKSDAHLETTRASEPHRAQCEFYAKLIALLLFNRVSALAEELSGTVLSPVKLWRRLRDDTQDWLCVLGHGSSSALRALLAWLTRYAQPSVRQKHPAPPQRLARAGAQAQQVKLPDPLGYLAQPPRQAAARKEAFARALARRRVRLAPERLDYQRTVSAP